MSQSNCSSLYQIVTRQWISRLLEKIGGLFTLDDIPNSELPFWKKAIYNDIRTIPINYLIPGANAF